MLRALWAEVWKLKRSRMPLWTLAIVCAFPLLCVGGLDMTTGRASATWSTFMRLGSSYGLAEFSVILFGLVTAYVFAREYTEGTVNEVFTLPLRREFVIAAKAIVLAVWVLGLTLASVAAQATAAAILGLRGFSWAPILLGLRDGMAVSLLVFGTLPLVALLAMVGRGYLLPMAFSGVSTAAGLALAEAGWARWFPWSMPMAVTGVVLGPPIVTPDLVVGSWVLIAVVFGLGSMAVIWYADTADIGA